MLGIALLSVVRGNRLRLIVRCLRLWGTLSKFTKIGNPKRRSKWSRWVTLIKYSKPGANPTVNPHSNPIEKRSTITKLLIKYSSCPKPIMLVVISLYQHNKIIKTVICRNKDTFFRNINMPGKTGKNGNLINKFRSHSLSSKVLWRTRARTRFNGFRMTGTICLIRWGGVLELWTPAFSS